MCEKFNSMFRAKTTLYIREGLYDVAIWLYLILLCLQYSNHSTYSGGALENEVNTYQ